ncbi:MAG: type II toxin-antitoxin system RelE/ParE family toxin, partial [Proteobacteria bacterium]|nr:type II toxin-antitoxin system RelE/ParE family toxin [Pseudomonadota bacterium]
MATEWVILYHADFYEEMKGMDNAVVEEIKSAYRTLKIKGPLHKRPHADTLRAGKVKNLKELRFTVDGVAWRVAYFFNQDRQGILLCAGK